MYIVTHSWINLFCCYWHASPTNKNHHFQTWWGECCLSYCLPCWCHWHGSSAI